MIKVGDKVVVVDGGYSGMMFGEILEVSEKEHDLGFWAKTVNDEFWSVRTDDMRGESSVIVKPYTESEAERRGAKFGVTGVVKQTGKRCVYLSESHILKGWWEIFVEGEVISFRRPPSEIRLDHEPEFIAWADAPEHLKYDASRVYFDGKPVKWIAKPEGAFVDVACVIDTGMMEFATEKLTVKL